MVRADAPDPATLDSLIADLSSHDGLTRQRARHALVAIGEPAVGALIEALGERNSYVHWEAAKSLSQIGSLRAAETFVTTLDDKEFSIRWLAAEGLIALGAGGLAPLLRALQERPKSVWLREGAHHVLHDLVARGWVDPARAHHVTPVIQALNDVDPSTHVAFAAQKALKAMPAL